MEMDKILDDGTHMIKYRHNVILIKNSFDIEILSQNSINSTNNLFPGFFNTMNKLLF